MKTLSIIILIVLSKIVIAQSDNNPYIYDSTNTVSHIKLIEYPLCKVFFHGYDQKIDQSENHQGEYATTITFQGTGTITKRTIILTFDKPVVSCEIKSPNGTSHVKSVPSDNNTQYKFIIAQLPSDGFSFVIYSKDEVFTKIYEVNKYIEP